MIKQRPNQLLQPTRGSVTNRAPDLSNPIRYELARFGPVPSWLSFDVMRRGKNPDERQPFDDSLTCFFTNETETG